MMHRLNDWGIVISAVNYSAATLSMLASSFRFERKSPEELPV